MIHISIFDIFDARWSGKSLCRFQNGIVEGVAVKSLIFGAHPQKHFVCWLQRHRKHQKTNEQNKLLMKLLIVPKKINF